VSADRVRLKQVLENLLSNAVKYAINPDLRVEIGGRLTDKEVRLYVRDNGPGIDPLYHERVFGLFERLDRRHEGTGVGLAIVRRIMQLHGGRAWVESDVGGGATFWIALPRDEESA
jgi:hypothetical protein